MNILSFGHVPSWAGGRQESGLANVIYNLAKHMSCISEVSMSLAATDFFVPETLDGNLKIIGWSKKTLLQYVVLHTWLAMRILVILFVKKIRYGEWVNLKKDFFKSLFLHKTIDLIRPDIVHLHGADAVIYIPVVPKCVKIVVTVHGINGDEPTIKDSHKYARVENDLWQSNRVDKIIFIASSLIKEFSIRYGKPIPSIESICNAYSDDFFYYIEPVEHQGIVLATVASLSDLKGQERVLQAIASTNNKIRYLCVGAVNESISERMKAFATLNKIDLTITGKRKPNEIRKILSSVDYMILPSSSEGFGLVFLEAIACGVPVILPKDLPIVAEGGIIFEGKNSLLMKDSSVRSICEILAEIHKHSFCRKIVSETVAGFRWEFVAEKYVESFFQLLN